ncbi:MAG: DOMON domain-containing protein [Candidatus Kariarchaeaceae archaeon]
MLFKYKFHIFLFSLLVLVTSSPHQIHSEELLPVNVTIDGVIGVDEYQFTGTFEGYFTVHWSASETEIYLALQAETTGYVAIGIDPEVIMLNADLIYGSVSGENVSVVDTFSSEIFGPPKKDTSLGGTFDILEYSGTEEGGVTTFEFRRLLDTGDQYDNVISLEGKVDIMWSTHPSDDFSEKPDKKGSGTIDFTSGETKEKYLIYYIIGGTIVLLVIIVLAIFFVRRKLKKKAH